MEKDAVRDVVLGFIIGLIIESIIMQEALPHPSAEYSCDKDLKSLQEGLVFTLQFLITFQL